MSNFRNIPTFTVARRMPISANFVANHFALIHRYRRIAWNIIRSKWRTLKKDCKRREIWNSKFRQKIQLYSVQRLKRISNSLEVVFIICLLFVKISYLYSNVVDCMRFFIDRTIYSEYFLKNLINRQKHLKMDRNVSVLYIQVKTRPSN